MSASATWSDWPATPRENESVLGSEFDGVRGVLYGVALSLVAVWVPLAFIIFGTSLITGAR